MAGPTRSFSCLLLLSALMASPGTDAKVVWNSAAQRDAYFIHIPKSAGSSFAGTLRIWNVTLSGGETCASTAIATRRKRGESAALFTLLREPRAHVLSQYLMCGVLGNVPRFDRGKATAGFADWVAHFAHPSWTPLPQTIIMNGTLVQDTKNDLNCYNPWAMQTRQLAHSCINSPHHMHPQSTFALPLHARELESANATLAALDFVGISELFEASLCLFVHTLGAPALPEHCFDAAAPIPVGWALHYTYDVPIHSLSDVDEATWAVVDRLTALDKELYHSGRARLIRCFDTYTRNHATRPLGGHLLSGRKFPA